MAGPQADDTLVVVTYDEFGGQWDHVPPPGQGLNDAVDSTPYDTTSISEDDRAPVRPFPG